MFLASVVTALSISLASPTTGTLVASPTEVTGDYKEMRLGKTVFAGATVLDDTVIPIRGAGTLRYMGFKVYSGALYAPKNTANLDAAPKRLTLHYYRSIDRKTIVEASWEVLADNPEVDLTALRPRLERLMTFINSVKEGDRYDLIHLPGKGLAVLFNAKPIGFVEGDDLARAYLGIWLSPTAPVNKHFRDHLLGKK